MLGITNQYVNIKQILSINSVRNSTENKPYVSNTKQGDKTGHTKLNVDKNKQRNQFNTNIQQQGSTTCRYTSLKRDQRTENDLKTTSSHNNDTNNQP